MLHPSSPEKRPINKIIKAGKEASDRFVCCAIEEGIGSDYLYTSWWKSISACFVFHKFLPAL
jgi:hypothetical protein